MKKIISLLALSTVLFSCGIFKPKVEIVEKVVTNRVIVTEQGDTTYITDTVEITKEIPKFLEREETKREKNALKYQLKMLKEQNALISDSLKFATKQNKDNNSRIEKLEKEATKQDRIHKNEIKQLEKQQTKQIRQQEKTDRLMIFLLIIAIVAVSFGIYMYYKNK